ncbi:hypothetical protein NDU88_011584 [Pleurodeles waltl]|uniref:Uncharacterized protein n=1 Tax=Pleurodeles waltl TaxID=8319 RepID=A0AAV7PY61_PLEWA|nr:hypothetical protein NDU88_011584 [Pleurodeles waltl]
MQGPVGHQMIDETTKRGRAQGLTTVADALKPQTLTHSELEATKATRKLSSDLPEPKTGEKAENTRPALKNSETRKATAKVGAEYAIVSQDRNY